MVLFKHSAILLVTIGLLLNAHSVPANQQNQEKMVRLKVLHLPYISFAPLFIADEEGYFSEQGLEIEFVKMNRSAKAIPVLAQGELDVVAGSTSFSLFNAMARGAKIKIVADKGHVNPTGCVGIAFMVRKALIESGTIMSQEVLKGKRVALNPMSSTGYFFEKILAGVNLTLADVEIVDITNPVKLEAFKKGTIDFAYANEPWLTRILQTNRAEVWMPANKVIPDFQNAFLVYGPTLLEENPDAGKRFMIAYLKAVQAYNQGKTDRNLEILVKHTELDRAFLKQACWVPVRSDGNINLESVLNFQAWGLEKKILDRPVAAEDLWEPSFIEFAQKAIK